MTLPALNFPASPTVGQIYPDPPVTGQPTYIWDGGQWLAYRTAPLLPSYSAPFDALGWSGMQINGSMEVSQEKGTTGTTASGYIVDGWKLSVSGTMVIAIGQSTVGATVPGIIKCLAGAVTTAKASLAAGELATVQAPIEGYRVARLGFGTAGAKPLTISFWTAHNRTGTYSVSVRNPTGARSCIASYTQNVSDTWEYKTVTFQGDTTGTWPVDNTAGMIIDFTIAGGSTFVAPAVSTWYGANYVAGPSQVNGVATTSDAFRLTGVVVLPGIEAPTAAQSPLIMRPYDQELVTCQRYWACTSPETPKGSAVGAVQMTANATTFMTGNVKFPVNMRVAPTATLWTNGTQNSVRNTLSGSPVALTSASVSVNLSSARAVQGSTAVLTVNNPYDFDIMLDARL